MSSWEQCALPDDPLGRGLREFQEDFEAGTQGVEGASTTRRPDAVSLDYMRAWSIGPVDASDTSEGLLARAWRVRADNATGKVYLRRAAANVNQPQTGWEAEEELFSFSGADIEEVDLGFDQNGAAVVCAQRSGDEVWLYWFNSVLGSQVFELITEGRNPRLLLDDPRNIDDSDLLLFYVNNTSDLVEIRTQRELYAEVESIPLDRWFDYATGAAAGLATMDNVFLEDVAKAVDNRLHVFASLRNPTTGRFSLLVAETVPYPYRMDAEEVSLSQRLIDATTTVYVLVQEWAERMDLSQTVLTALVEELVLNVGPLGPDGFLEEGEVALAQSLLTALVEELVLNVGPDGDDGYLDEMEISLSQALLSALVETTVIVIANQGGDELALSQSLLTAAVSTI